MIVNIAVIAGIIVCIYLSNFFSGSEMAYSSCNEMRLESDEDEGDRKAGLALYIARHFDDALGAILIGNNLVNIACSSLGSVAVILIAGIAADNVNLWLKQAASRPRYKYLITLEDPASEYRNWWQMTAVLASGSPVRSSHVSCAAVWVGRWSPHRPISAGSLHLPTTVRYP